MKFIIIFGRGRLSSEVIEPNQGQVSLDRWSLATRQILYTHFMCYRVGLLGAIVGIVETKVTTYIHPVTLQWASGCYKGLSTEEACLHWPPSGTRQPGEPVLLEEAVWRHQVGCWRAKPVKQNVKCQGLTQLTPNVEATLRQSWVWSGQIQRCYNVAITLKMNVISQSQCCGNVASMLV